MIKEKNGYYEWSIRAKTDIESFKAYLIQYPLFSKKKLFLINKYYELKDLKAYSALSNSPVNKAWLIFSDKLNRG